jgi:CheY-like chemotaxis protein
MEVKDQPHTVLVADDSAVFRKLIENTISSNQFAAVFAKTGQEAMQLFAEHKPPSISWEQGPNVNGALGPLIE